MGEAKTFSISAGPAEAEAAGPRAPLSPALTVAEAASALKLDPRTIRSMVRTGELLGNRRGHAIRVSPESVLDWLRGKGRASPSTR